MQKKDRAKSLDQVGAALGDPVLIAQMRMKPVPLSFVMQRCGLSVNLKHAIELINGLDKAESVKAVTGSTSVPQNLETVSGINPKYLLVKHALHLTTRIEATRPKTTLYEPAEAIRMLNEKIVSINTEARALAAEFSKRHYRVMADQLGKYERVLAECNRCVDINEALKKLRMSHDEWRLLKSAISRYGMTRDILFGKNVLIDGKIINDIEQRFLGRQVTEIIPRILVSALESPPKK